MSECMLNNLTWCLDVFMMVMLTVSEPFIFSLMQADVDNSGTIDYGEFLAAMLHLNKIQKEDHLFAAFSYFDKDGSGYITPDELQQAYEQFGLGAGNLDEIIREVDQDNVIASTNPLVYVCFFFRFCDMMKNPQVKRFFILINNLDMHAGRAH